MAATLRKRAADVSIFDLLAEERIRGALERGELSGLPGEGRPLEFDDDGLVPADIRMTNKILRNAGYVPPALADLRELRMLAAALAADRGEDVRAADAQRMVRLLARVEAAGLSHVSSAIFARLAEGRDTQPFSGP